MNSFLDQPCRIPPTWAWSNSHQTVSVLGLVVTIHRPPVPVERYAFATTLEAMQRAKIVAQAMSWIGTPFKNCADVKGRKGGVDCAMLLVRSYVDAGVLEPFDPRPYPPHWHLHQDRERFLEWIVDKLHGIEVERPQLGDVLVWQYGRCFAHGSILINEQEMVHAYYKSDVCHVSRLDETDIKYTYSDKLRPVRYFNVWGAPR